MDISQEIEFLKKEIEKRYGGRIESTTDFETLAADIEDAIGEHISSSTLKRIWGYVSLNPRPRISTLDILAQYTGRNNYRELFLEIQNSSEFISPEVIHSKDLQTGALLQLQWIPDRVVKIKYLGRSKFRVIDGGKSKLLEGDIFETEGFIKNHPLYISCLTRKGELLPVYVAGKSTGLSKIELL